MVVDGRAREMPLSWVADEELSREFETLLIESSTLAFRVAYSVVRHREDAEDVAQDAFAKAYRNFRQLRDRARFRAWLVRMTWRLAIDRQRADRRRMGREARPADPPMEDASEEAMQAHERSAQLWQAIDALPEKLRVAIVLSAIEGHDVSEVALLLGVPAGTVKSRLFLARKRLQESLKCLETGTPAR